MQLPVRPIRRHSMWLRKYRRSLSCALAVVVVGASAIALSVSGAAPATVTWNLPYPQTMSYRILSEDRAVKCSQPDSVFQQEVASQGLDQYEIAVTDGHHGECGRLKAEQFKRLYPAKMVIAYDSTGGGDPRTYPGGSWAGYYLMMNRTTAAGPVTADQTLIPVANPAVFSVGDTVVMFLPNGSDPYANSEWVTVKGIVGSTLVVARNIFGTGAQTYDSAPFIASEATGPGFPDPVINFSNVAPVNPASGLRANQWMANSLANDFAPSTADGTTLDGIELDTASWTPAVQNTNGAVKNVDCDGDGVIDYCYENVGTAQQVDAYGVGYDQFIQALKQGLSVYDTDASRPAKMVLADGELGLRSLGTASGAEFESFPTWDDYSYSSPALDTLGVWSKSDTAAGSHLSYAFTKDITPVYPQSGPLNPAGCIIPMFGGTCRNAEYRYGLAGALISGAASTYNNEASFLTPQPWDEEGTINQSTTGLAPGYLGQPLGPVTHVFRYTSGSLTTNGSFETDLAGVSTASLVPGAVTVSRDTTTAALGVGSSSLRVDVTGQPIDPNRSDARVFTSVAGPLNPGEYTINFWAKGVSRVAGPQAVELGASVDGTLGAPQVVLLTNTWTHYDLQVQVVKPILKNADVKFSLGSQIGTYWLDGVKLHAGTAGVMTRQFTNGIVVLNDSFSDQANVPLPGGPYHHINGVQDRTINDGSEVGSVLPTIASKDGEVLLRG